jgi:hypothetical protein
MVRFFVMELIHLVLNPRFNMSVIYLQLIILLVVDNIPSIVRRFLTGFLNLKIKPVQSFRDAHRGSMYVYL